MNYENDFMSDAPATSNQNSLHQEHHSISIYDVDNKLSLVNLTRHARDLQKAISHADQVLLAMDEVDLRARLKPTQTDNRLRLSMWYEIDRCLNLNVEGLKEEIKEERIYAGIVSKEVWKTKYLINPKKMAWLLTPVGNYSTSMEEALETGTAQLRKILSADLFNYKGELDVKAAKLVIEVFKILDARVNGTVVQKHAILHGNASPPRPVPGPVQDLDEEIKRLENHLQENIIKAGGANDV